MVHQYVAVEGQVETRQHMRQHLNTREIYQSHTKDIKERCRTIPNQFHGHCWNTGTTRHRWFNRIHWQTHRICERSSVNAHYATHNQTRVKANQNHAAEHEIRFLAKRWKLRMAKLKVPKWLWDYGLIYGSELLSHMARATTGELDTKKSLAKCQILANGWTSHFTISYGF
jgi:hypothetical protein